MPAQKNVALTSRDGGRLLSMAEEGGVNIGCLIDIKKLELC